MDLDGALAAAAASIAGTPEDDWAVGLEELRAELRRRREDDIAWAKHTAFVDSLELEQAAYELGRRYDEEGDIGAAARWYRVAAKNDHADAALRLGMALDLLAERCARQGEPDPAGARRQELYLVTEAAKAYAEAYAAGHTEAADKVDEMLAAFTRRQTHREPVPAAGSIEGRRECSYVRDFIPQSDVLSEDEIQELSRHAAQCLTCMAQFITLIKATAATLPTGAVTHPFADDEPPGALRRVRLTAGNTG